MSGACGCYVEPIMATKWSGQLRESLTKSWVQAIANRPLLAGVLAGGVGLVVSFALKGLIPARPLGDPVPLVLAVTQVTRGFTYLPWRPALFHLLFAVSLGVLAFLVLLLINKGPISRDEATRAGRIAALINVVVVALLAVDALMVAFWYLVAGLISVLISGLAAGLLARWWPRS